jgi:hypothetical protein
MRKLIIELEFAEHVPDAFKRVIEAQMMDALKKVEESKIAKVKLTFI